MWLICMFFWMFRLFLYKHLTVYSHSLLTPFSQHCWAAFPQGLHDPTNREARGKQDPSKADQNSSHRHTFCHYFSGLLYSGSTVVVVTVNLAIPWAHLHALHTRSLMNFPLSLPEKHTCSTLPDSIYNCWMNVQCILTPG